MKVNLLLVTIILTISQSAGHAQDSQTIRNQHNRERAAYWAQSGYNFDPDHMTASMMDRKVRDFKQADFWKKKRAVAQNQEHKAPVAAAIGGRNRIQHDLDPMRSWTVRPRAAGGYRIENDFDPLNSKTVRPRFGRGYMIEDDY